MDLTKHKRVRLKGKAVAKLNREIHERDSYTCIVPGCNRFVIIGEKWHHEPCGKNKEDVPEKGCLLCLDHHIQRESKNGETIRQACEDYLNGLYPERSNQIAPRGS
ncbi:hypothetical protein Ga0466249_002794 [Sporomusaceae bacterium BoRhaA]|uniref:hypothetical protein n=1 Tax=Pelorhabdus rhamnosifermentans TaxID=2772457 RepID=UPI001C0626A8|nr:hypothetical protein [Pelorhabdus rhamnosifermentans]MBU2701675.1 hypothetical protein [Pelorhabdus rhamnosifermentans]